MTDALTPHTLDLIKSDPQGIISTATTHFGEQFLAGRDLGTGLQKELTRCSRLLNTAVT